MECSASVKVWQALDDALDTKNWDVNAWNEDTQRVFCSLIGFCVNITSALGVVAGKEVLLLFVVEYVHGVYLLIMQRPNPNPHSPSYETCQPVTAHMYSSVQDLYNG